MNENKRRGGARPGAGRKRNPNKLETHCIRISGDHHRYALEETGNLSRYVRGLIDEDMKASA